MHIFHAKFRLFFCQDNSSFVHYIPCMDIAYHPPMPSIYYQHVARTAFCIVWINWHTSEECSDLVTWSHVFSSLFWLPNHRTPNRHIPNPPELFKLIWSCCHANCQGTPKETKLGYESHDLRVEGICHMLTSSQSRHLTAKTASYCNVYTFTTHYILNNHRSFLSPVYFKSLSRSIGECTRKGI